MASSSLEDIVLKLFEVDAVKFGKFTLKSGIESPVYFDLRVLVSYPQLMTEVSEWLYLRVKDAKCDFTSVCGVPYTALPLATCISFKENIPMLIRRKEAKGYGTKKMIEGKFSPGDKCLVIEDLVTSGSSVLETVQSLGEQGLIVKDAVVLLNREQGGRENLASKGITLHSVCGVGQFLDILLKAGKLSEDVVNETRKFIADNYTFKPDASGDDGLSKKEPKILPYEERSAACSHPLSKQLFSIMAQKKTNLSLSADVTSATQLLKLADEVGPYICVLKTHIDIIEDFNQDFITKLSEKANKHNFLIFEDRKFADIGNTVRKQYGSGMYCIADWSHIINAHALPGPGIVEALKQVGLPKDRGCLLIAEMSSKGNLALGEYTKATIQLAEENCDFVMGFISQSKLSDNPNMIHMTPGVRLEEGGDSLGQQYLTPDIVIGQRKCDIIIVGRGIIEATNPVEAAVQYRDAGHRAYLNLINA